MSANEVSALLWRERELLELLLFKLEEEQLILTAGKTRWLHHATREVEQVMERLRTTGLSRTVEVATLGEEWGAASDATLRELVAVAPDGPWPEIFVGHLRSMTELADQIREVRDLNEQYLRTAVRSTQETLAGIDRETKTYDSNGLADTSLQNARLFDQKL
jgi:hypothetical protein